MCSKFQGTAGSFTKKTMIWTFPRNIWDLQNSYILVCLETAILLTPEFVHVFTFNALMHNFVMVVNFHSLRKNFRNNTLDSRFFEPTLIESFSKIFDLHCFKTQKINRYSDFIYSKKSFSTIYNSVLVTY